MNDATETEPLGEKLVRKITTARMVGAIDPVPPGETRWLYTLTGHVTSMKEETSDMGDFVRLVGEFLATSFITGEEVAASSAILPGVAQAAVVSHLRSARFGEDGGSSSLIFAMDIGVEHSLKGARGYQFVARPVGMENESPLRKLHRQIKQGRKEGGSMPFLPSIAKTLALPSTGSGEDSEVMSAEDSHPTVA